MNDIEIDVPDERDPGEIALWYKQFEKMNESQRKIIVRSALMQIKRAKPDTYKFIQNFKCKLVGVTPHVEYALASSSDEDLEITWVHSFSSPTLLFWCETGQFGFFVNPVLRYNDTVLNEIEGNKKQELRGFTG